MRILQTVFSQFAMKSQNQLELIYRGELLFWQGPEKLVEQAMSCAISQPKIFI